MAYKMMINKNKFLKTEFGSELSETVTALDFWLSKRPVHMFDDEFRKIQKDIDILFAKWEVYQLAMKQFYGIEYHFSRTDSYFGVCTEDESDWLFKKERDLDVR